MQVALITGASQGFGRALARSLADVGWRIVIDARSADRLRRIAGELSNATAIVGDVIDAPHRAALADVVRERGRLDLLVNNASYLGPSPLPELDRMPLAELRRVYEVDVVAPLALTQALLPWLAAGSTVVNVSSDAAVEAYQGWGGYGSAKAALDHLTAVLAVEHPSVHWYSFDPGDMRTAMHQAAFPGEDISDRPEPETVVPSLLRLLKELPESGRYRASDFAQIAAS